MPATPAPDPRPELRPWQLAVAGAALYLAWLNWGTRENPPTPSQKDRSGQPFASVREPLKCDPAAAYDAGQAGVGPGGTPAHTAAELVGLREAELISLIDDDRVGVRDIEAGLDDRRADEYVSAALNEIEHRLLQLLLGLLAVPDQDLGLRYQFAQLRSDAFDAMYAVVDEVDLAAALKLTDDRLPHEAVVELGDVCLDRQALFGRGFHRGHVADAAERHVQRPRDRRSRERERIDLLPHLA